MTLARFLTDTAEDIDLAAQTLAAGELLGLPTETVYGLAADRSEEHTSELQSH